MNEFPLASDHHQFSYGIPVQVTSLESGGQSLGDITLDYRYQWANHPDEWLGGTKLSLIAPTGDIDRGSGRPGHGLRVNNAVTVINSQTIVTHFNLGSTIYPANENTLPGRPTLVTYDLGASVIYLFAEEMNFFTEFFYEDEATEAQASTEVKLQHQRNLTINPGVRYAINQAGGGQWVPGLSFPITVGDQPNTGALLYLSFEDKLW